MKPSVGLGPLIPILVLLTNVGCTNSGLPKPGSAQYRSFVSAFYIGLGGLQSGEDVRAKDYLTRATQLAPGEPAGWANLALLQARQQEYDAAFQSIEKAHDLTPSNGRIEALLGAVESKRGNVAAALNDLKKAVSLDPNNLKAEYLLAQETERQAAENSDAEARESLQAILKTQPNNLAVLLDVARLSAKLGDSATLQATVASLGQDAPNWPDRAKQQFTALQTQASGPTPRAAAVQAQFLRNVLLRVPNFRRSLDAIRTPAAFVGEPFPQFLKLPSPHPESATADAGLHFESQPIAGVLADATWLGTMFLDDKGDPSTVWADRNSVHIEGGATLPLPANAVLTSYSIVGVDLNYDFKTDLVISSNAGVRIFQQQDRQHFTDITAKTKLPASILNGSYVGAWAFDIDLDGDLDIVLGVATGQPAVLRNNGDSTFTPLKPFKDLNGLVAFASADIDGDGDPDIAVIDGSGKLNILTNERLGDFHARAVPSSLSGRVLAITAADADADGLPDFIVLKENGTIVRLSDKDAGAAWDAADLVQTNSLKATSLLMVDLDNNGALDLVVGDRAYLNAGTGFTALAKNLDSDCQSFVDLNGDGLLDAVCLSSTRNPASAPFRLIGHSIKNYHWQAIRTRAANGTGDQRINSFGIGGEVEVRAGLLTQKQIITSPMLHFGLGEETEADLARIVWPNGLIQVEFALKPNQTLLAEQRLKGSCPFLFAWDGTRFRFVKDCPPWSPALGLHINAQKVASISQTQEWFKIPGDQLNVRNGFYDFRVTAEYWETFYIDHYSFLVVDHPSNTQVYADERFAVPAPPLKLYATNTPKSFMCAIDNYGTDVSAIVQKLDQTYLDTFGRGQYQGVTRDHWVELQLPNEAPQTGPLYLIASGWMHPTDATVNIALGQNSGPQPQGLSIEVPDATGKWIVAKNGLGFPSGRLKTVVLDLTNIFKIGAPRKLRLRTNLEIYWDQLSWAPGVPVDQIKSQHISIESALLRYRGFSRMTQANPSSPELPDYNVVEQTGQKWRDLEGYYTRYGDVRDLLRDIDDRIVIANAGDELQLRVPAPPPPPLGWSRDLVMVGDGWIKDGDYNSTFSKTVLPLPYHGLKSYNVASKTLEDDPGYKLHPADWQTYHTRYVSPENFVGALWK